MTEQSPGADSRPTGERRSGISGTAVLGVILIAVGIVFFIGQQLEVDWGAETWPFYVVAPGLVLLAFGLTQPNGSGMTIAGSIVTMVGLLLFYQNVTNNWESWAYAWALVAPGGSGVGMLLYGTRSGNARMARDGFWQIVTAGAIFAVGFIFFEGVLGISGNRWNMDEWVMPAIIIGLGVLVLIRALFSGRRSEVDRPSSG